MRPFLFSFLYIFPAVAAHGSKLVIRREICDFLTTEKMTTSIHITALDGVVNVNSLFTLAVFIGLAWNPNDPSNQLITASSSCTPTPHIAQSLISFHVYSFCSFLFSSLIALALKQAIKISNSPPTNHAPLPELFAKVNKRMIRVGMLVSGVGSVCGCGFLMMALVNVVQFKLGMLGCSGKAAAAVVPLVILVPTALLVYVCVVVYAFTR